jgi:predicted acyltransferase
MIVVGMNSVAMYVMAHLWDGWIWKTYQTHINVNFPRLNEILYKGTYSPILQSALVLATLWWFCYWLYKRKVFIRI